MLRQHIIPLMHKNVAQGYYNADKIMIEQCHIIPIEQHGIYANGNDAALLNHLHDLRFPEYLLDSAMCYAELKIIRKNTSSETCINKFHKICNVCSANKTLRLTFLGPRFTQHHARQLKEELHALKYKGKYKHSNFQTYIACHKKIYQKMQSLKTNGYTGIDFGTCVHYLLGGIKEPSLKTTV